MSAAKRTRWSSVWRHFNPNSDFTEAECKLCDPKQIVKFTKGSTSALWVHLSRHAVTEVVYKKPQILLDETESDDDNSTEDDLGSGFGTFEEDEPFELRLSSGELIQKVRKNYSRPRQRAKASEAGS